MTQAPPGWFPDPAPPTPGQPPMVRYWDGHQWTEHVQPLESRPLYGAPPVRPAGFPPAAGPTTPDGVPLAGWWHRVAAFLLDSIVLSIASSIVTLPLQLGAEHRMQDVLDRYQQQLAGSGATTDFGTFLGDYLDALGPILRWSLVVSFLLWLVYSEIFLRTKGATPGMMVLGIGVRLRATPGQLRWSTIFVRVLVQQGVGLLALLSIPLYLALSWFPILDGLWPLWNKRRQAIHDIAAQTNVVRTR
jgi:uncharacterized RDD family membrane protein YckC